MLSLRENTSLHGVGMGSDRVQWTNLHQSSEHQCSYSQEDIFFIKEKKKFREKKKANYFVAYVFLLALSNNKKSQYKSLETNL